MINVKFPITVKDLAKVVDQANTNSNTIKVSFGIQRTDRSYRSVTKVFADQQHYDNYCKAVKDSGEKIIHESILEL